MKRRAVRGAADEVRRACAEALASVDPTRAAKLGAQRLASTLAAHDLPGALGAALDRGLDAMLDGEEADAFDAVLLDVGLLETVAARLEVRASATARQGSRPGGPLTSSSSRGSAPGRSRTLTAPWAPWISALAADPSCEDAIVALRSLVGAGDRALGASPECAATRCGLLRRPSPPSKTRASAARRWSPSSGECSRASALSRRWPTTAPTRAQRPRGRGSAHPSAGTRAQAAAALERVSVSTAPSLRAVLLATAARRHLAAGDVAAARRAAELGTRADPASARCVASLADAVCTEDDRAAAAALERGVSPRRAAGRLVLRARPFARGTLASGSSSSAGRSACVALRPGRSPDRREAPGGDSERRATRAP